MPASDIKSISSLIKHHAYGLGFDLIGIAPSGCLAEHENIIRKWCASGMNGEMSYIGQNLEKRLDPAKLFPGVKSVIVTGLNYFTEQKQGGDGVPVLSRYSYGASYHDVIKIKLDKILDHIKSIYPMAEGKSFVDSAPLLEKAWAQKAGLGWPGRHSVLINNKIGSFFFLGIILLNLEMEYDDPFTRDLCGSCTKCIGACPTGAINENKTIDVRRCIAYLTIESKKPVDDHLSGKLGGRVFGCDRCQEVCPWNKHAMPHKTPEFELLPELRQFSADDWKNLTKDQFKGFFKNSAIGRRTYKSFMQNVSLVTKGQSDESV